MYIPKTFFAAGLLFLCLPAILLLGTIEAAARNDIARCKGHGYVKYTGHGVFFLNGTGVLIAAQDASITFDRALFVVENLEAYEPPACISNDFGKCIYFMENERVWISGSNIDAAFSGANIGVTASGNATLFLKGYGMYRVGMNLGRWGFDGTTLVLEKQDSHQTD